MMINEFEALTKFHPSMKMYEYIEAEYMEFDGDKQQFCKAYVQDKDGLASKIQRKVSLEESMREVELETEMAKRDARIAELEKDLDRELEWKPYEAKANGRQSDYEALAAASDTEALTDSQAKQLLYDWYGFAKEKVTIIHTVEEQEINRHGYVRKVGEIDRRPLYNATDWNYIRFDCGRMSYELINDDLRPYLQ